MTDHGLESARILLVDDDALAVEALADLLAFHRYTNVQYCTDPMAGLEAFFAQVPDLLILDMHMPGVSGLQFVTQLHSRLPATDIPPVLIVTGDSDPGLRDSALALGTLDCITKPFRPTDILLRTRNLLRLQMLHKAEKANAVSLEQRVRERTAELRDAHLDTVYRLARAAEFRDDITGGHIQRVGSAAAQLAASLGQTDAYIETIGAAAQLHDIGKIGIPDAVLLKPGKLDPEEFNLIKTHTSIGAEILAESRSTLLAMAREIAVTHHERWDGGGYPYGIAGDEIPLSGRITSVVDVFDALTHDRPYKEAWPVDRALEEIARGSGRMFDPEVCDAFRRIHQMPSEATG